MDHYQDFYSRGEQYEQLRPFLLEGEQVLWLGKPYASVPYRAPLIGVVFALFFFGFAVFWTVGAMAASFFFGLFGFPFMAVGAMLLYTFTHGARRSIKNTIYAVTDRRAIILLKTRRKTQCTAHFFQTLGYVSLQNLRGNCGSIQFHLAIVPNGVSQHSMTVTPFSTHVQNGFLMIDDAQRVHQLISQQIAK